MYQARCIGVNGILESFLAYFSLVEEVDEKSQTIEEAPSIETKEVSSQSLSHLCGVYFHGMLILCLVLLLFCSYY